MAGNEGDEAPRTPDDDAMRARLDQLSGALEARRAASPKGEARGTGGSSGDTGGAMAKGLRAASELVAGILVGGFIGWQLDWWLGTKPWLSIVFFLLGVAAGFWNVMRVALAPTGGSPPNRDSTDAGA